MRGVFAAVIFAALAIVVVMFLRDGKVSSDGATAMEWKKHGSEAYAPDTVLKIAPSARGTATKTTPDLSKRSPLAREMAEAKSYKPIYDRMKSSPEGETPEGLYYLARMLSACAQVTDRKYKRPPPEEARAKFVASVSEKDPKRAERLAAHDSLSVDRCADLRQVTTTEQEIKDLRARAAAAGEPKARAQQLADEVWATANPSSPPGTGLPTITDAQIATLRELVRSADPVVLQTAGAVFASTLGDLQIRAGPDQQPIDPRAFHDAWLLASCEYGANCGRDNYAVASGCAYEGRCGVDNLGDYFFFYGHSPAQSQNVGEYSRNLLNAIRTGDWSYFHFAREAPANAGSTYRFGGPH